MATAATTTQQLTPAMPQVNRHQPGACPDSTSRALSSSSLDSGRDQTWELPLDLPPDLLVGQVLLPYLSPRDKAALRQANTSCRRLANAAVTTCVLDAYGDTHHAHRQLALSFPNLQHLRIICTPPTTDSNSKTAGSSSSSSSVAGSRPGSNAAAVSAAVGNIQQLQQELPLLLQKLPKLSTLAYEGPRDRRQTGLDITHALQQLLEAATAPATTAATTAAGAAAAQGSGSDSSTSSLPQQPSQQLGCQQVLSGSARGVGLTVLECVAGSLPDVLMEVVGGLRGLVRLKLSSTTALHMAPVSNLTALTAITMTVTPPLPSALCPLARLTRLCSLSLSALSPARGWGAALARLSPCPLRSLTLTFADVCDDDMQHLAAALTGLTRLNLNCSRHLSPGCVPHLARLSALRALHLEETGLQLGQQELITLGGGCTHLNTLEAAFDLRGVPHPHWTGQHGKGAVGTGLEPHAAPVHALNSGVDEGGGLGGHGMPGQLYLQVEIGEAATQLDGVTLSGCRSVGKGWPPLRHLVLSGVSVGDFNKLLTGLPGLESLVLNSMGLNASRVFDDLVAHPPPLLTALSLAQGGSFSEGAVRSLGGQMPRLKSLSLTDITLLPHGFAYILADLARHAVLESLTVCRCAWMVDLVLAAGVAKLTSLKQLQLSGCGRVTGEGLLSIAPKLPQLTCLLVGDCEQVKPGVGREWERSVADARVLSWGCESGQQLLLPWVPRQDVVIDT